MTAVKRAASERLHQFAAETGLFAANTGNEPKESRYSFAGTWRLPGVGHDGREKLYQLDYTFMCPKSYNMLHSMRNRWSLSRFRWTAER